MLTNRTALAAFTTLLAAGPAAAQFRCDCTSVVDTCTADVVARGSFLEIKTSQAQCARVDYFVDGQPFVSVVVDGEDRQDWLARTANPKIMVQSCQVCRENEQAPLARAPAVSNPPAAASDGKLEPLISGVPEYPAAARARGTQGHVDVEFTVTAEGAVENARVTASEPRGVFDQAALAAVARWQYPPAAERAPLTLQERIDFALTGRAGTNAATAAIPAAGAGPRNECVRQDAVYNYGDSVDVGLVNVCAEAVHVYGCAPGTGRYADRWLCNASEDQGSVLVGASDRRLGTRVTLDMPQGTRTFTYADGFSVTRAPNSPYSWVACAETDSSCRTAARSWTRSIAGQPASVDPQARSPIEVARSR